MKTSVTVYKVKTSCDGIKEFYTMDEAKAKQQAEIQRLESKGHHILVEDVTITTEECEYINRRSYSDVHPFEIVRVVSNKTLEIREMDAELLNGNDLQFHIGGFAAHCSNQHSQKYKYTSNTNNNVVRVRLCKDGYWRRKGEKFNLSTAPYKFYDYNF